MKIYQNNLSIAFTMNGFQKIIVCIGAVIILVSFIYAFALRKKKGLPGYFSFFYWIPFLALLASVNSIIWIYLVKYNNPITFTIQDLFFLSEFTIACLFFHFIFGRKSKITIIIFSVTIVLSCMFLWINDFKRVVFQLYTAPGLATFILCMYYYYRLFDHDEKPIQNLFKTPTFWMVTGLFFFSAITLPLFAIQEYFNFKFGYKIGVYVATAANVIVIIKHLFFIKACRLAAKMEGEETKIIIEDV